MSDITKWSVPVVTSQLGRVYTGGLISQVVLGENLEVSAHSDDSLLLISWMGSHNQHLPHPLGIMDLGLLLQMLQQAGEYAYVYLDGPRLVIEGEDSRSSVRLVTAHTDQIPNQVDEDMMANINEDLSQYPTQEVPSSALQEVTRAQKALGTDYLAMEVSPSGTVFVVGSDTQNRARVDVPELTWEENYEILLPAEIFRKVISLLHDDSTAKVRLTGPDSVIEISQASARHIISDLVPDS